MAQGTCFEKEINEALENLEKTVQIREYKKKLEKHKIFNNNMSNLEKKKKIKQNEPDELII